MLLVLVRKEARTKENGMLAVLLVDSVNRLIHLSGFLNLD
jgi:hypothetical protein